jgi:hypothetical protein
MYPAFEINLHLDRVSQLKRQVMPRLGPRLGP